MEDQFMQAADVLAEQKKHEVTQKYENLKKSYEDLLLSYDKSEELRKIYKHIVLDQRNEITSIKNKHIEVVRGTRLNVTNPA